MIRCHKLQPGDFQRRVDFCQWLTNRPPCFLENFIIGDEAGFAMNTPVNTHNVRDMRREGKHHKPPPADINELQWRITAELDILRQDRALIRIAVNAMLRKAAVCIQRDGGMWKIKYEWLWKTVFFQKL